MKKLLIMGTFLIFMIAQAQSGITVTGSGTAYGEPDIAIIELGVNIANEDISTATDEANNSINQIMDVLSQNGIDSKDIRTSYFNIWTEEPYDGQPTRKYRVNNVLSITVRDVSKVGEVLSQALDAGANMVNSIQYAIAETDALAAQARELAMQNARAKAEQLASLSGVSLGVVEMISDSVSGPSYPEPMYEARAVSGGTPVSGGQLAVSATVQVRYTIVNE